MQKIIHPKEVVLKNIFLIPIVLLVIGVSGILAQTPNCTQPQAANCGYGAPLKHQKVSGLNIGGIFKGLLQYLPPNYHANPNDRFPLIIYFHGLWPMGDGSADALCKIFCDAPAGLPGRIERNEIPTNYIIISPQYDRYWYPTAGQYPSANEVEAMINYVVANYKVNLNRVYLTGMSSGANMVIEYASSSATRANRIAAIALSSVCSQVGVTPNTSSAPTIIANANLPTWFIHCSTDNTCQSSIPQIWYNDIVVARGNPSNPDPITRLSIITPGGTPPCIQGSLHNTWDYLYDPTFRVNGTNVYEWFNMFSRPIVLPVQLKNYTARLVNGKVEIGWSTTSETDNISFTIERAGTDQRFISLATIPGNGTSNTEKKYSYPDDKPLDNISYYRLSQTDADGKKRFFDIKKIVNLQGRGKSLLVSPNPFFNELSLFVTLPKKQKLSAWITDLNGRKLKGLHEIYPEGTSEINFKTNDLPAGIYLLKVDGENLSEIRKILKQ